MERELYDLLSGVLGEPLPLELQSAIARRMSRQTIKKNTIILREGDVNSRLYFIQRGILRAYSIQEGVEVSSWIKGEGEFVVSISSFYPQAPSLEFIHALEDTEVFSISHADLFFIYRRHLEFSYIGLMFTIQVLVEWDERRLILQIMNRAQRFEWFMKRHSNIVYRSPGVPDKYIASYLGMTPQTLSKIKSSFFKLESKLKELDRKAS
jgi:CRP/FNR family transcriptional regulator, anaerobic regulatory protein